MLLIACVGGDRFAVRERRVDASRLQRARIELLPDGEDRVLPERHRPLAQFLRALAAQPAISRRIAPPEIDYGSAREVGYRLAELLPLGLEQQQALLEEADALARLDALAGLLRDMDFTLEA